MQISRRGGPTRCKSRPPSHATMRQTRAMASWAPRDQRVGRLAASHHLFQPITPSLLRWPAVRPRNVSWFLRSPKCQSSSRGGQISETLETAISHHFSARGGKGSRIRLAPILRHPVHGGWRRPRGLPPAGGRGRCDRPIHDGGAHRLADQSPWHRVGKAKLVEGQTTRLTFRFQFAR